MLEQIKNTFRRNKLQKFVALISATALWFFVMDTQNPIIKDSYTVPISMANVPPKFKAFYFEQNIQVKLSAPRSYFIDYDANSIRAFANLQNYSAEGEYEIPVEASFPKGFELEGVSPATVHVILDPFIEKQMKVDVVFTGTPANDSVVKEQIKSSENVTLMGPKSAVSKVKRVMGYVDVSGRNETFDIEVPMSPIDEDGRTVRDVRIFPSSITVTVQIENDLRQKTVPVIANVTVPQGREISQIIVAPKTVDIIGREEFLNDIDSISTEPLNFVVNAKTFIGKLKLVVPEGVTPSTSEVDVTCRFKE